MGTDFDGDGLVDLEEYDLETDPLDPDTDGDLNPDGDEVAAGTDPFLADSDELATDVNQDGVIDALGLQLGYYLSNDDDDDDGISNADELILGTDPIRSDTDGDGVSDASDDFPFDPAMTSLGSDPGDTTPPAITLTAPSNAVLQ